VRAAGADGWKEVVIDKEFRCCIVLLSDDSFSIFGPVAQWLQPCSRDSPIGNLFSSIIHNLKLHDVYRLALCVPSTRTTAKSRTIFSVRPRLDLLLVGATSTPGSNTTSHFRPLCASSLSARFWPCVDDMGEDTCGGGHEQKSQDVHQYPTMATEDMWRGDSSPPLFQYSASRPKRMGRSV